MTRATRPGEPPWPDQPTFTPHGHGPRSAQRRASDHPGRRQGASRRGEDRPGPTFTPRAGHFRPPDTRQRAAYPPPAVYMPTPGIPQNYTQPFDFPEALPGPAAPRRGAPDGGWRSDVEDNRTRVIEVPEVPQAGGGPRPRAETQSNLARSSMSMALGTLVSRSTGFLRTFVLLYALGTGALADAYNNSNALPQTIYYLMLGGVFTSVVVPLLVKAARNDPDRGEAYAERIFTLGVVALLTVTVIGTLLAGPLVDLYAGNLGRSPTAMAEHQQMVLLAHFSMPQIFFFGMDSLLGAILNTRGRFGANMWTPLINNVVVIAIVGTWSCSGWRTRLRLTVLPGTGTRRTSTPGSCSSFRTRSWGSR
jgi:Lipid II flippase MurJ